MFYDGEVIFSKLEQRRLPTIPEILDGLGDAIAAREGRGAGGAERERSAPRRGGAEEKRADPAAASATAA